MRINTATIHKHCMNTENKFLVIEMSNEGTSPCGLTCAYQIPILPKVSPSSQGYINTYFDIRNSAKG